MTELVRPFTERNFYSSLTNSFSSREEVQHHRPAQYLYGYLTAVKAESLVVEFPYTDGDFLDDYAVYYAKCYTDYHRRCKRIHFFRGAFSVEEFRDLLTRNLSKEEIAALCEDYLGFIVARPLPEAIIGRTVLRTYDRDSGRRNYECVRPYQVNLFGLPLQIVGLAFQEQDTVLAACATCALWSAFHKVAGLFGTPIPRPAEITSQATQSGHLGRPIPQHGLQIEQICGAIRSVGLEPEVVDFRKDKQKQHAPPLSLIHGYLRMGIPVILVVDIPNHGSHAITLTGFSTQNVRLRDKEIPGNTKIMPMVGLRIDELYGHDDQTGPHARLIVDDTAGPSCAFRLKSSWPYQSGGPFFDPVAVVIPVYNKIRLTFLEVLGGLTPLHTVFSLILPESRKVEWDVHLILSNRYKEELKSDPALSSETKESLLLAHHPRFWWRAVMKVDGQALCEVLCDATGIARSLSVNLIIWKVQAFASQLEKCLADPVKLKSIRGMLKSDHYLNRLRKSLEHKDQPGRCLISSPEEQA